MPERMSERMSEEYQKVCQKDTAVRSWRLRSSAEHCHPTLAVEEDDEERRGQASRREESSEANTKSNNPHLTGGKIHEKH